MANVLINENSLTNVANAIRAAAGTSRTYKVSEMPAAIGSISGRWVPYKDGKTHFTVVVEDDTKIVTVLGIRGTGATLDWGDGSTVEELTSTLQDISHTYENTGEYEIVIAGDGIELGRSNGTTVISNNTNYCVKYMELGANISRYNATSHSDDYALRGFYINKVPTSNQTGLFCYNCNNVTDVIFEEGTSVIGGLQGCPAIQNLTIPTDASAIWQNTFQNAKVSESISLTNDVSIAIGSTAFKESTGLRFISLNAPTISFSDYTFQDCKSLKKVILEGTKVTSYGRALFSGCISLTTASLLPSESTLMNQEMFRGCTSLKTISIPQGVITLDSNIFNGCTALETVILPNTVTTINTSAFQGCTNLKSITLPSTVTSIGSTCFRDCTSMESINIPEGVSSLPTYCFYGCTSLTSMTIPSTVTSISTYTFAGCTGILEYHLLPTTPPTLANKNAFNNINANCIIYVPAGTLNDYQTTSVWSNYASYMQEET